MTQAMTNPRHTKPEFVYVTYIETTQEKLWQALTEADFTERYWFGYRLQSDFTVGARATLGKDGKVTDEGVVLECDPPRRLAYTWHAIFNDEMAKEKPSRVSFDLEKRGAYVKLTVTHEDFAEASKVLPSISTGWPMVLSSLKSLLETGRPLPLAVMQPLIEAVGA
jgi:uncharacterized protein YndB with AHSA1/START domain